MWTYPCMDDYKKNFDVSGGCIERCNDVYNFKVAYWYIKKEAAKTATDLLQI